jgi:hypothetical protein
VSLILLAALVLAAAEPGAATATEAPAAVAPVTVKAKPDKKKSDRVCWDEKPTGSHMPAHICVSREEYEIRQRADQEAVASGRRVPPRGGLSAN